MTEAGPLTLRMVVMNADDLRDMIAEAVAAALHPSVKVETVPHPRQPNGMGGFIPEGSNPSSDPQDGK